MQLQDNKRVWACIGKNGYVATDSVASTKAKSIKKFVEMIPYQWQESWEVSQRNGWKCMRINIRYEIDNTYYKKKQI